MESSSNSLIKILRACGISVVLSLVLLCAFAILLTYTNLNENTMPTVIIVITLFSILVGSQIATRNIKKNGILNGVLVGVLYMVFIYFLSSIITKNFSLNKYSIIMIITSIFIGGVGGIIGVNRK